MSRVLPILFNTDMVKAILDGRKTVTRRRVGEKVCIVREDQKINKNLNGEFELYNITTRCGLPQNVFFKPPYQPGDILYVRETWSDHYVPDEEGKAKLEYCYKADGTDIKGECLPGENNRWYPSIHMPKEAARIFLRVTDVRVERLQDITNEQILKEGVNKDAIRHYIKQMPSETGEWIRAAYLVEWSQLWDSTIKRTDLNRYGWEANPWVWVIEFKRVEAGAENG